ncbi:MAG: bifunctional hydroxymethylpyrimidine kinase/phosphomethylpyrimidine kinase [Deltaproteobacteria bacterium]|nr:bifunctional hydroxymethylpyrimidine kinase/phosphomethylpyrimidine kinase [Deltaproteobacteria bacterium]
MLTTPTVLLVGGLDPGGQAGLAADLEVCALRGAQGRPVVAARTAQSDGKWYGAWPTAPAEFAATLDAALAGSCPRAGKTGMLATLETAQHIARTATERRIALVVDPLLRTTSGGWMWQDPAPEGEPDGYGSDTAQPRVRSMFWNDLLPACAVVTPNWPELAWLVDAPLATDLDEALAQAQHLPCPVLLKGGHAPLAWRGQDFVIAGGAVHPLPSKLGWPPRPDGTPSNLRGTGCRLATALAIELAKGTPLLPAAAHACEWLDQWAMAKLLP